MEGLLVRVGWIDGLFRRERWARWGMSDLSHPSRVIVTGRPFEFGDGIHDERTVADDGSIQRIAADQQQLTVLLHCDLQRVPGSKAGKLPRLDGRVGNRDLARHDIERKFTRTRR